MTALSRLVASWSPPMPGTSGDMVWRDGYEARMAGAPCVPPIRLGRDDRVTWTSGYHASMADENTVLGRERFALAADWDFPPQEMRGAWGGQAQE